MMPLVVFFYQEVRECGDQALLRKSVLSVQHEVHRLADRHVRRPPGLALQAEPRREGCQQEGHTPTLVLQSQGEHACKHTPKALELDPPDLRF